MIAMAKAVYYPKGERQKTIIKLLNSLEGRYSRWDIWQDFIVLSAVSIANAVAHTESNAKRCIWSVAKNTQPPSWKS